MSKSKTINENIDALFSRPVILPRRSFLSAGAAMSAATLLGSTAAVAKDAKAAFAHFFGQATLAIAKS
jgi:hypothetical protein